MSLTVVVLTHNSGDVIIGCLNSVRRLADEIIVIDDDSCDETLSVISRFKAKVFSRKLKNFSDQRNFAVKQVKSDWVLFVDTDERITQSLAKEIIKKIKSSVFSAYQIRRLNYFFGQPIKHGGYWPDWQTRLFKVKDFRRFVGPVHESPQFSGQLGEFDNHLIHFSHKNLIECLQKSFIWTKKEAEEFIKINHPKITGWRIMKVFILEFCYRYFKKMALLNGFVGLTESLNQAINRYFVYQQIWEMQQQPSIKEKYLKIERELK